MAYNFGLTNFTGFAKARQWLKGQVGPYAAGKPPVDNAGDNNYQDYADNVEGTGAIPTFKPLNLLNQFEINAGHAVVDNALTVVPMAVPATPTAVVNGTAGSTSRTYKVVGRAGNLQAPSATVTVATGNATLSAVNSITLTWVPTPGFKAFDIYRTAAAGTPSTTGLIGSVSMALGPNVATPTMSFVDTGLVADASTAPTANTTGGMTGFLQVYGNLNVISLATPAAPLVQTQGATGAATWTYKITPIVTTVATSAHGISSAGGSVTTGPATLTAVNSNLISWQPVPGAVAYNIYRTAAGTTPSTTGLIGTTVGRTFVDTGIAGDSAAAPSTDTTGVLSVNGTAVTVP